MLQKGDNRGILKTEYERRDGEVARAMETVPSLSVGAIHEWPAGGKDHLTKEDSHGKRRQDEDAADTGAAAG